jgi:hypothetical protein
MATPIRKRSARVPSAAELKVGFSARLNELLNEAGVPLKGKGRQKAAHAYLAPIVGPVTDTGVRKWMVGTALPELEKIIQIAIHFDVHVEWLLTMRGDRGVRTTVSPRHLKLIECYEKADQTNRHIVDLALGL